MRASDYRGGSYYKADDFEDGLEVDTVIEAVDDCEFENGKHKLGVVLDYGEGKTLVLNTTNLDALIATLGDDTDRWIGARIKVKTLPTKFKGQTVMGITIVAARPGPAFVTNAQDGAVPATNQPKRNTRR